MKSLTTLTTLFQFTITKMKYLTTLATVFLLLLLLKWILWLRSLRCFTSLLLKWYLWLRSLHCFTFTTIKIKSLTTLTTLFYFTTINPIDRTTITTLLCSFIHQIVFPRNFSVSIKFVCATVISLLGSSVESYMLYYPLYLRWNECRFWNTNQFTAEFMISITRGASLWNRRCY